MPHFAPFYEIILDEIKSLPLNDTSKIISFVVLVKRILPGPPDDSDAIEAILREWHKKLTTAGFNENAFGLSTFLEEFLNKIIQKSSA